MANSSHYKVYRMYGMLKLYTNDWKVPFLANDNSCGSLNREETEAPRSPQTKSK